MECKDHPLCAMLNSSGNCIFYYKSQWGSGGPPTPDNPPAERVKTVKTLLEKLNTEHFRNAWAAELRRHELLDVLQQLEAIVKKKGFRPGEDAHDGRARACGCDP